MLYIEVTERVFINEFDKFSQGDKFTREGLRALFRYMDAYSEDIEYSEGGGPMFLDVMDICKKISEYKNLEDAAAERGISITEMLDGWHVIEFEGGVLVSNL